MADTAQPINLFEFEDAAKELLPKAEYDYIAGGATDEISVDRNRRAYASWAFRPRVLRDVSKLDLSTTVLGCKSRVAGVDSTLRRSQAGASRRRACHLPRRGILRHGDGGERQR